MATYNRSQFIMESLKSIKNQTFKDWECIVIDDGSTDDTMEAIEPVLIEDNRFKYFKRTSNYQKGLPGSRNFGLDKALGDYIVFFDDDDIVHPQNLEICVSELQNSSVSFCRYLRNVFFDSFDYNFDYSKEYSSFMIGLKDLEGIIKNEIPFNSCAVMWKKECFKNHRFVEHLMYSEEWELYSRIISNGVEGISINKCLFYGRKHPDSNTGEFYRNDSVRRKSKKEAIILVIKNLKEKDMLSDSILGYFIKMSIGFKEYKLFEQILNINSLRMTLFKKLRWRIFYFILPFRLYVYKVKKHF